MILTSLDSNVLRMSSMLLHTFAALFFPPTVRTLSRPYEPNAALHKAVSAHPKNLNNNASVMQSLAYRFFSSELDLAPFAQHQALLRHFPAMRLIVALHFVVNGHHL